MNYLNAKTTRKLISSFTMVRKLASN